MNKILNLSNYKLIKKNQFKNKKIGMCHGVFDILHIGHIKHFEHAKS